MKTLWIDITDIRAWEGNLTGIQRVVTCLGSRLAVRPDVKFFYFEPGQQRFIEADFDDKAVPAAAPAQAEQTTRSVKRAIAHRIPARYKAKLRKIKQQPHPVRGKASPFAKEDMVAVLGGNWGDVTAGFMQTLHREHDRLNLYVAHVLYDMIPYKFPNFYIPGTTDSYKNYMNELFDFAEQIICISESTKRDAQEELVGRKVMPKFSVVRLGEDIAGQVAKAPSRHSFIKEPFIICVGTIEARKNHTLLYYVVKEALRQGIELPRILLVGRRGWMTADVQNMIDHDPFTKNKLLIVDDISDSETKWLYQHCLFAVYPSLYEGWGLPLAEAAHYGKLCIASDTSSMPEVLGDLGDYFSPYNTQACLDKLALYANDAKLRQAKEKALAKRSPWLWDDSYKQLLGLLNLAD